MNTDGTDRKQGAQGELTFADVGPLITDADLDEAERRLMLKLPAKYRAFLRRNNGGVPSRRGVRIAGHPDGTDLFRCFHGVRSEPHMDLLRASELTEYMARRLLAIGHCAGACLVCLDLSKPGVETVVYMEIADPDEPHIRKPYFLAHDIDEFCAQLTD